MPALTLFAGVDGGASKTLAVVIDSEGRERGRATVEGANYAAVGLDRAVERIGAAVAEAARVAGGEPPVAAAWLGLAGVGRPGDHDALLPHLRRLAGAIRLTNDAELALSALPTAVGVVAIAGTGSIAVGRDARGGSARAGGWGHVIGDEGSGYDLGRRSLQAAARASDGRGPATALLDAILAHWQLTDPMEMIDHVYHDGADAKAAIARLARVVIAAAGDGDPVAVSLVDEAAAELALATGAVADRLAFGEDGLPLALSGGLLIGAADFRAQLLRRLERERVLAQVVVVPEPAVSAARAAIGLSRDGAVSVA